MATRLYFPETQAAQVAPPTPGAEWEHNNGVTRQALLTPDSSTLTTTAYTPDAADHLVDNDAMHRQYVTDSLAEQDIAGTVKAQFQSLEANAGNNLFLAVKIYSITNTGTAKDTLLAITRSTGTEIATSLTNRSLVAKSLSSARVNEGDRLVFEIGVGGLPTAAGGTQGHNGSLRFGCSAAGGDLPENETDTGTTLRGWVEFSQDIRFGVHFLNRPVRARAA